MVAQYISLVSAGLTYKEFLSRMSAAQTYAIDDQKKHLTRRQKLNNFFKFMCRRKNYKSNIPKKFD